MCVPRVEWVNASSGNEITVTHPTWPSPSRYCTGSTDVSSVPFSICSNASRFACDGG